MNTRRPVWYAVYYLSGLLIVTPLFDLLSQALPVQPGEIVWRYGFLGLLANNLLTPLLGLVLAAVAAAMLDQRRVLRALSFLSYFACALIVTAAVLFLLDVVQLGPSVPAGQTTPFRVGAAIALGKYAVSFGGYLITGWTGLRAARRAAAARGSGERSNNSARPKLLWQAEHRA